MVNNYIWLFGENLGKTADNNSFYLWKKVVNINDDVEKYIIFERNKNTLETYVNLTEYEKKYVLWRNSYKHFKKFFDADLFIVTLSYKDVFPDKILFQKLNLKNKKPIFYLGHGPVGIKTIGYKGDSYNNNIFRLFLYNNYVHDIFAKYNNFRKYQLPNFCFQSRFGELVRRNQQIKNKKQILWFITWREYFGDNADTRLFIRHISNVLESHKLKKFLIDENVTLKLCVHQFFDNEIFEEIHNTIEKGIIEIVKSSEINVMNELVSSELLISDYSSVVYDFTFLNKPVLLFQPDIEAYMKKRDFYCNLEELNEINSKISSELIEKIINKNYKINEFFRKTYPEKIDYEYIKQDNHNIDIYNYIYSLQKNKITIIGTDFFENSYENDVILRYAESLLKQNYLVSLLSLTKSKSKKNMPFGLNINYLHWNKSHPLKRKLINSIFKSDKYFSYLNHEQDKNNLHPYMGYKLSEVLKNLRSNTVISTRESLHLFLNDADSDEINNKIYLFPHDSNQIDKMFPYIAEKLEKLDIQDTIFFDKSTQDDIHGKLKYSNCNSEILNTLLIPGDYPTIEELTETFENNENKLAKSVFQGISFVIDKASIINLMEFGCYLKENNIKNIMIDAHVKSEDFEEFMKLINDNQLYGIITCRDWTEDYVKSITNKDFTLDMSNNNSNIYNVSSILNGKKVFYNTKNNDSIINSIPESYIESHSWLYEKINSLNELSYDELINSYLLITEQDK